MQTPQPRPALPAPTPSAIDVALLTARIIVGVVFAVHGSQKLFGAFGGPGLTKVVAGMGAPLGYLVTIGEFFGGLGIVVGFLTRFSSASLIVIMVGAIVKVHLPNGFFMNWGGKQAGEGYEYHLLAIAVLQVILLAGPGQLSLGRYLSWKKNANGAPLIFVE